MQFNFEHLNPKYQSDRDLTLGFVLSYIFCFHFKSDKFDRGFAYILHITRIKNYKALRLKYKDLTDDDLLKEVFFLSRNDKCFKLESLREMTGIRSKDTFRNRFKTYFKENNLLRRRAFNLEETYGILEFWNPGFKGESMEALLKSELAKQYTNGNCDELAEWFINNDIISKEAYESTDKLSPKIYNNLIQLYDEKHEKEEEDESDRHIFFFLIFLISRIKK